jgi:hypothetical protein
MKSRSPNGSKGLFNNSRSRKQARRNKLTAPNFSIFKQIPAGIAGCRLYLLPATISVIIVAVVILARDW